MRPLDEKTLPTYLRFYANWSIDRSGVDIRALLKVSAERVLLKEIRRGDPDWAAYPEISHVCDWLAAAVVNDEPWLKRVDAKGRPLKLMKFGSYPQIVAEADKAMRKARNRTGLRDSDLTADVVMTLRDGYRIVRLTTPAELDDESRRLGHCVGNGSYDMAVASGVTEIHSLRDLFGNSHATIETHDGTVRQVKGKQNAIPKLEYYSLVADWLEADGRRLATDDKPYAPPGFAVNAYGRLVDIAALRPGDTFVGDLETTLVQDQSFALRGGVNVEGNLTVIGGQPKVPFSMPVGLLVSGKVSLRQLTLTLDELPGTAVWLSECSVDRLPGRISQEMWFHACLVAPAAAEAEVVFEANVCFELMALSSIYPKGWRYSSGLSINRSVACLPAGMEVGGDLEIKGGKMKPEGALTVRGSMVVRNCEVLASGHALFVDGNALYLNSVLDGMPANTAVGGDLMFVDVSGIGEFPASVKIGRSLKLEGSDVGSLGGRTEYAGSLIVVRAEMPTMPDGVTIHGSLVIREERLKSMATLPRGLDVRGSVAIVLSELRSIPDDLRIGGNLRLSETLITTLPDGFHVEGNLEVCDAHPQFRLPEAMTVGKTLIITGSQIERMPEGVRAGALHAAGSALRRLPDGFAVPGDLNVVYTPMGALPEFLSVGGTLRIGGRHVPSVPETACVLGGVKTVRDPPQEEEPEDVTRVQVMRRG